MKKVITYGTYDMIHYGHIRLLERARDLGDYLIVGVTSDDYDRTRGKINTQQTTAERVEAIRRTGLADEVLVEEYEGQKIDDIIRFNVDVFAIGSDWVGRFDYLKEYCDVVYLARTEGISSSEIRQKKRKLRLGMAGGSSYIEKVVNESKFVDGIIITGVCSTDTSCFSDKLTRGYHIYSNIKDLLDISDAVYIHSNPMEHYYQSKKALTLGKHVLCESPLGMNKNECEDLFSIAKEKGCIITESLRTPYSTAYHRLLLLIKGGTIGNVISVDATCTSLRNINLLSERQRKYDWSSLTAWGPTALLPVFQILGIDYRDIRIETKLLDPLSNYDLFTKISFTYNSAVATIKVGKGVKSEGELIISGTEGYIHVPAPWWKTDYFEVRYENQERNRRFFYQLEGEGIRNELAAFSKSISNGKSSLNIDQSISLEICNIMDKFNKRESVIYI